mmetsp:Transcript_37583/g.46531  ORF Transcript_37583/g.46531 Transcript_37583/m.46531 type:complete len:213 (-) Transcript_37583:116-754(-)
MSEQFELRGEAFLAGQQKTWSQLVSRTNTFQSNHGLIFLPQCLEHAGHPGNGSHLLAHPVPDLRINLLALPLLCLGVFIGNQCSQSSCHVHCLVLIIRQGCSVRHPVGGVRQWRQGILFLLIGAGGRLQDVVEHLRHLFDDKGHTPLEHIHEVGQMIWMRRAIELQDVQRAVVEFEDGTFVVVDITVVGCGENGDDQGKACAGIGLVHLVAL